MFTHLFNSYEYDWLYNNYFPYYMSPYFCREMVGSRLTDDDGFLETSELVIYDVPPR